jgi:hypothetical protein
MNSLFFLLALLFAITQAAPVTPTKTATSGTKPPQSADGKKSGWKAPLKTLKRIVGIQRETNEPTRPPQAAPHSATPPAAVMESTSIKSAMKNENGQSTPEKKVKFHKHTDISNGHLDKINFANKLEPERRTPTDIEQWRGESMDKVVAKQEKGRKDALINT